MLDWLKRAFRRRRTAAATKEAFRRWEAAKTDRLNQAQWKDVTGASLNTDLLSDLATIRARAAHEVSRNPTLEGVITTHAIDIVGESGPSLNVQSADPQYNARLEEFVRDWFRAPEASGQISIAGVLSLWVRALWIDGEFLGRFVTDPAQDGPITTRLLCLHASRLDTPPQFSGDPSVTLGIRRNEFGRPTQYYLNAADPRDSWGGISGFEPVPPDIVVHKFIVQEPGQARGVPWLAPSLQAIADLRDYDVQVLDAARQAADFAVFWYTDNPQVEPLILNESAEIERRMQQTGPPGWKPMGLQPTQPTTMYVDYRKERLREIGRPVGMPLMAVRLAADEHNYSSARFDGKVYGRALQFVDRLLSEGLSQCVDVIAREAELAGLLPPRPRKVVCLWTWPKLDHVDPEKEGRAIAIRLVTGESSFSEILAESGKDIDSHLQRLKRDNEALRRAGFEPIQISPLAALGKASPAASGEGRPSGNASTDAGSADNAEDDEEDLEDEELETAASE
jgi:lambda family phage portal protein